MRAPKYAASHVRHQPPPTISPFPALSKEGRTSLHIAADSGFEAIVGLLLDRQAGARICDNDGCLPLHLAVLKGHTGVVAMLMGPRNKDLPSDKTAMLRSLDKAGRDAVMMAAGAGHAGVLQALLAAGANANATHMGCPAVCAAASFGHSHTLRLLAAAGANMDARVSSLGASALHVAAAAGHVEAVSALLQLGANTSAKDNNGRTPIEVARAAGQTQTAGLLREHSLRPPSLPSSPLSQQQQQQQHQQQPQPYQHNLFPDRQPSPQSPCLTPASSPQQQPSLGITVPTAAPQAVNYPSLPPGAPSYY
ncbi:MAG: hypothetical protein WDW38_003612 [Sanguina aurantia]